MRRLLGMIAAVAFVASVVPQAVDAAPTSPPYFGTIFNDPDIVTDADPTAYTGATYTGQGSRLVYDRRPDAYVFIDAFLFDVTFSDGLTAEGIVNVEFGSPAAAAALIDKYAVDLGRLPTSLRRNMAEIWIHDGPQLFGGATNAVLIHDDQGDRYIADGILAETFIHELAHTSLDPDHAFAPGWIAAQNADPTFISTYAQDFPFREDVAETFVSWFAVRHAADRIDQDYFDTTLETVPNRLAYFDSLALDLFPYVTAETTNDPAALTSIAPERLLDTRTGNGVPLGGLLRAGSGIRVQIAGRGSVPADATSIVANLTIAAPAERGFATAWGEGAQPSTSSLNFAAGQAVPNQVVVPLDSNGGIRLFVSTSAHAILDVAGYHRAASGAVAAGRFVGQSPVRLLDSRSAGGRWGSGEERVVPVVGRAGLPSTGVAAAVLNVTVTQPSAAGHATLYPVAGDRPLASNLNYSAGLTAANHVIVPVGPDGAVRLFSSQSAHYIVDVVGHITDGTVAASSDGLFVAVAPTRLLDTRSGQGDPSGCRCSSAGGLDVTAAGVGPVPSTGVAAIVANAAVIGPVGNGFLVVYPDGALRPVASNLNFVSGSVRANLVTVLVGDGGAVAIDATVATHRLFDVAGYYTE